MTFTFEIERVSVLQERGTIDKIRIYPKLPTAFPEMQYPVSFNIEARCGYGATWCREVLGVDPEVIPCS